MALITYPNKNTGDTFSGAEATEIKTVVNLNRNESDASLSALSSSPVENEVPSGAVNSVNVTFTLANTPIAGSVKLFWNGMRLKGGGVDYSISVATITMATAPTTGDILLADYRK